MPVCLILKTDRRIEGVNCSRYPPLMNAFGYQSAVTASDPRNGSPSPNMDHGLAPQFPLLPNPGKPALKPAGTRFDRRRA